MIKRIFDIVITLAVVLMLAPVIVVCIFVTYFVIGTPIFFKQRRPGFNGSPFFIYKFRSMSNEKDVNGKFLPDAQRLTNFGRFLRSTSLDELPSLWNVFKGDMSLVGPRPLLMEYAPLYNTEQARRHLVKPGVTGWAQVNGRNAISWEEKFNLDVWYVDHQSLWLDIKIIFLTVKKVFFRNDISAKGEETMPKFTGSNNQ